jgi:hypothetical protein
VVGDLGRAVIRHIADEDIAGRRGRPCDLVVADPHAHDRTQPRKTVEILGGDGIAHDHQPVDLGAVGGVEVGQCLGSAPDDPHLRTEDLLLEVVVRDLPFFGVEHRDRHWRFPLR